MNRLLNQRVAKFKKIRSSKTHHTKELAAVALTPRKSPSTFLQPTNHSAYIKSTEQYLQDSAAAFKQGNSSCRNKSVSPSNPAIKPEKIRSSREKKVEAAIDYSCHQSSWELRKPHQDIGSVHGYISSQNLEELMIKTKYNRHDITALWIRFKALCSLAKDSSGIDKETFRRGVPLLSVEDSFFVDRVFSTLVDDGSGTIDWEEFVEAMACIERGDVNLRLQFLFKVYDIDGDGRIQRQELFEFFIASLLVTPTEDVNDVAKHFVNQIFEAVLAESDITDSSISIQDVQAYIKKHNVSDIYNLFGRSMV